MFIPSRQLRMLVTGVLGIVAVFYTVSALPRLSRSDSATPVWVALDAPAGLHYIDGYEDGPGSLSAGSTILVEANTGTVLYADNEHEARPMASTTKIMTALVALETTPLDEMVTAGSGAVAIRGSQAGLRAGQQLTMFELLYGLMLPSGNDAANVVAEHVGGTRDVFIDMMNARARELGAQRTSFANAHGLDAPNHYSTAYDLALISSSALHFPTFSNIVRTPEFQPESMSASWRNTNRLLWSFDGIEGVKTGSTSGAGYCLVAAASRGGMRLITITLGSPNRWQDTTRLLEYGFDEFHLLTLAEHGDVLAEVDVPRGIGTLRAVVDGDFRFVVRDAHVNKLNVQVRLEGIDAPVRVGDTVGHFNVYGAEDTLLHSVPLVAGTPVARRTIPGLIWHWLKTTWQNR